MKGEKANSRDIHGTSLFGYEQTKERFAPFSENRIPEHRGNSMIYQEEWDDSDNDIGAYELCVDGFGD